MSEANQLEKERIREKYKGLNQDELECVPAKEVEDVFRAKKELRVAVYARVSTDDPRQTSSYELQKNHYMDVIQRNKNWKLVNIYADEGISGTSLAHRESFKKMIQDCEEGKIDMIITKSVSRFARNILDCIGYVRQLRAMNPPIGVFFEAENIHTLNPNSEMTLSFIAAMAQEESHNKSEVMNASIEMRFRRGIFLLPTLLGYDHDENGNLVINKREAKTIRLIFYLYLSGNSCQSIADILTKLKCPTKKGNLIWSAGSVLQILQNERYCGDVLSRKTWTPNYLDHKSRKNRQNRNQYKKLNHHEPIISRYDYLAVQRLIMNAKYGGNSILPELKVIPDGVLRGYALINLHWAGFKASDYISACKSISPIQVVPKIHIQESEFDLHGFEVARAQFMNPRNQSYILFSPKALRFNQTSISYLGNYVELLINTNNQTLAVRPSTKEQSGSIPCSQIYYGKSMPKIISSAAFIPVLYKICNWNTNYQYRCIGVKQQKGNEKIILYNLADAEILIPKSKINDEKSDIYLGLTGARIVGYPISWAKDFGPNYYQQRQTMELASFDETKNWNLETSGIPYKSESANTISKEEAKNNVQKIIKEIQEEKT